MSFSFNYVTSFHAGKKLVLLLDHFHCNQKLQLDKKIPAQIVCQFFVSHGFFKINHNEGIKLLCRNENHSQQKIS